MAPVIWELQKHPRDFHCRVCVTGQHRQMIDPLLKLFGIYPDLDLHLMKENQTLEYITQTVLQKISSVLVREQPDYLVVQGDTTTAMAASLAAFYKRIRVAHVEAGLRTGNKYHPYPEEVNRRIIDSVGDLFFAHTSLARENLLREGIPAERIEVTGNTVIDALLATTRKPYRFKNTPWDRAMQDGRKLILMTAHRRENFDEPIRNICQAIKEVASRYGDQVVFVYPVHLNPNIQRPVNDILRELGNVILTSPMEYLPFVHLMKKAYFILTDSGGLQEEAPSLGKPVLVMRQTTERPEGVAAGCVELIGTKKANIIARIEELLENRDKYTKMSRSVNPYGDGRASQRIAERLLKETG